MGHVHAELMKQYAEDAANHERPWELWEFKSEYDDDWSDCVVNPEFHVNHRYRRKPKKIIPSEILKGIEIDEYPKLSSMHHELCKDSISINYHCDIFNIVVHASFATSEQAEQYAECFKKLLDARK